jgi:hypothetical protein
MLAKLTSKNQISLPAAIVRELPETKYFSVSLESGRVVLTPMHIRPADAVRRKLEALGITESDVEDAVRWARKTSC